jgi:hypothetical protein
MPVCHDCGQHVPASKAVRRDLPVATIRQAVFGLPVFHVTKPALLCRDCDLIRFPPGKSEPPELPSRMLAKIVALVGISLVLGRVAFGLLLLAIQLAR